MARPKKDEAQRRTAPIPVKFTVAERARLLEEAERLGLSSVSELIRQRSLTGRVVVKRVAELAAPDRVELNRLGVNLHQLVKHLNVQRGTVAALDDVREEASRVLMKINALLVLGEPDGSKSH